MAEGPAAYEYRVFAPALARQRALLDRTGSFQSEETRTDTYFAVPGRSDASLKVRDGRLDLKLLRGKEGTLELWERAGQADFPVERVRLEGAFLEPAGIALMLPGGAIGHEKLLSLARADRDIHIVEATKTRRLYLLEDARVEFTEVTMAGKRRESAAVEDHCARAALRAVALLGIADLPNTSYQRRLLDMIPTN